MATVTHAVTTFTTAAGNKTGTATPALNDLIVIVVAATGVATTAVTDNNADGLGTYTKISASEFTGFSTTGNLNMWVRNALIGSATSTIFSVTQTSSTGGGLDVYRIAGMSQTGAAAVRGYGGQSTGTASTAPAPVLSVTPLTGNPIITAVASGTNPPALTAPGSFTATVTNTGYTVPTTGLDTTYASSGITSATVTWGSNSATAFASMAVEFTTSPLAYSGGPQGWSSPAGVRAVYVRTGICMASQIPLPSAGSPPVITTTTLPAGITGQPYTATLAATGGTGPYTWSITTGSLPSGLTLNSSTGVISGTPTGGPGPVYFTVKVTDSLSSTATQPLSVTIAASAPPQPIRAKIPKTPLRGVYSGWDPSPTGADTSFGTGQVQWNAGGAVQNPNAGPAFRQAVSPARARIPRGYSGAISSELAASTGAISGAINGSGFGSGMGSNGSLPRNPGTGPVFRQATAPARARLPQLQPRAGRIASNPGAPVRNPGPGPAFRQAVRPARAPIPQARASGVYMGVAPKDTSFGTGRIQWNTGGPVQNPGSGPVFAQKRTPVRPVVPPWQPRAGRIGSSPGGPLENPHAGPPVYLPQGPVRARLPQLAPRAGRAASNAGAPLRNPGPGPVFQQAVHPAAARFPGPFLKGRTGSNPGAPLRNPAPGTAFTPFFSAVRAKLPVPFLKGRVSGNPGAPVRNPGAGPVFRPQGLIRGRIQLPPRGRVYSSPAAVVKIVPPVTPFYPATQALRAQLPATRRGHTRFIRAIPLSGSPNTGPVFTQAATPARIRPGLPPRGRIGSNKGGPVPPPPVVAPFRQQASPARIRPALPGRGRISSGPGAQVHNPGSGPVFRQASQPARIRVTLPPRGRIGSNPGGPIPPPPAVAPFAPRTFIRARMPLPPRGTCRAVRVVPLPVNPGQGPAFTQATSPARIRPSLPPRGRIASNAGGPIPPPPVVAPFRQESAPARIRPTLPPRGRVSFRSGGPLHNPNTGPVFRQAAQPARIKVTLPPRGRAGSNPGTLPPAPPVVTPAPSAQRFLIRAKLPPNPRGTCRTVRVVPLPVPPAVVTTPFYPKPQPVRAPIPQRTRGGQIGSNPGGPLRNPGTGPQVSAGQPAGLRVVFLRQGDVQQTPPYVAPFQPAPVTGPPFRQATQPARARFPLPPRGRTSGNPGGPVRNPHPGPVFRQAVHPIRGIIPQNAPRGRIASNPGGPVENIPNVPLLVTTGSPFTLLATDEPFLLWTMGSPFADPQAGEPFTDTPLSPGG